MSGQTRLITKIEKKKTKQMHHFLWLLLPSTRKGEFFFSWCYYFVVSFFFFKYFISTTTKETRRFCYCCVARVERLSNTLSDDGSNDRILVLFWLFYPAGPAGSRSLALPGHTQWPIFILLSSFIRVLYNGTFPTSLGSRTKNERKKRSGIREKKM